MCVVAGILTLGCMFRMDLCWSLGERSPVLVSGLIQSFRFFFSGGKIGNTASELVLQNIRGNPLFAFSLMYRCQEYQDLSNQLAGSTHVCRYRGVQRSRLKGPMGAIVRLYCLEERPESHFYRLRLSQWSD